ncbi:hypothetical protein MUN86_17900 [Hymenobacter volaticus]|uniref:DUF4410 domain-containing protein n=1 Tax=Hymenobacter volaticus TaxID=2932254 RepID=A0ABY4G3P2_9BACT|nr:hypothetical protein MUN86_17900 [Hymenobacter volaticus]
MAQDFRSYAPKHKTVAILPAFVTMQLRPNQAKNTTPEQQREMENKSGMDFQEKIYAWLLRRSQQRGYTVQFQDVMQTNARLRESQIPVAELRSRTPQELAKILGVDAVLTTSVRTSKPMSDGAAVAVGLIAGAWGATNQANITVNIHESDAGKLLWKYDYVAAGSVFSSSETVVDALMRNASKKFPYTPKS